MFSIGTNIFKSKMMHVYVENSPPGEDINMVNLKEMYFQKCHLFSTNFFLKNAIYTKFVFMLIAKISFSFQDIKKLNCTGFLFSFLIKEKYFFPVTWTWIEFISDPVTFFIRYLVNEYM